jgi:ATP-dependent exoDNAse (exonuclease V) beta subunit
VLTDALGDAPALKIEDRSVEPPVFRPAESPAVTLSLPAAAKAAAVITAAHERSIREFWSTASVTAELKRLPRVAVDEVDASDPTQVVVPKTMSHRADAGAAWGSLVHGLLEHAMRHKPATRDDLRRLARWLTVEDPQLRPVIEQAVDTVLAVAASDELAAARATVECYEEVPFAVRATEFAHTTHVRTGSIDLVHRHGGGWRVVDYKTDVDQESAALKYDEQVRAYADAWAKVSGSATNTTMVAARER